MKKNLLISVLMTIVTTVSVGNRLSPGGDGAGATLFSKTKPMAS